MNITERIAALPDFSDAFSDGGSEDDRNAIDLIAALARLELAREWIEDMGHKDFCTNEVSSDCTCGRDALLEALKV